MLDSLWISSLGENYVTLLGPISLLVVGYLVEKNFVGRVPTFTNALAINLHVYTLAAPTLLFVWYANIGLILGVIALVSYGTMKSLNSLFYAITWLYSSVVVGFLILLTL